MMDEKQKSSAELNDAELDTVSGGMLGEANLHFAVGSKVKCRGEEGVWEVYNAEPYNGMMRYWITDGKRQIFGVTDADLQNML